MQSPLFRPHCRLVCLAALVTSTYGYAAPAARPSVNQRGDFVLFGNTLGWDCGTTTPTLPAGTTISCANTSSTGDSAIDIYFNAADDGTATAASTVTMANARSTAELIVPNGATITHARLYWAAMLPTGTADDTAVVDRPGLASSSLTLTAERCWTSFVQGTAGKFFYQCAADLMPWLQPLGAGAVRVGGVTAVDGLATYNDSNTMAGWFAVVYYSLPTDPPRNLTIFEGLDSAYNGNPQTATISGFLVPAVFDAKVGVVAYEGDADADGDSISLGPNASSLVELTNALNPVDNFFNSSRTYLAAGVSNPLDRPRLPGTADTMGGIDMDVVDVRSLMTAGQTSATIRVTSSGEHVALGALVTSISTFQPDFSTSGKSVVDVNGGALVPGDQLEYTIVVTNTGSDTSTNTVMTDVLPTQVTYVPGSLAVVLPTAASLTDAVDSDVARYTAATRTITVNLGTGATAAAGGTMTVGSSTTLRFRVTLNGDATGTIANQAVITAAGVQGAPASDYPTDGNGASTGNPPTTIGVDADNDGLLDTVELTYGTDPMDADSDDDGVQDGAEPNPNADIDGDGLINALDPDSDNDGLFDGTELGLGCSGAGTTPGSRHCVADADPSTTTNPLALDTDGGGRRDGAEDTNLNGRLDAGESDPTTGHAADDTALTDTDGDGLTDGLENWLGSDPTDRDSDDDGVLDGLEPNPSDDGDGDGLVTVLDSDSDDDGLFDGTEMSLDCANPATDVTEEQCTADADPATHTSPLDPDSDDGGVRDGFEDLNRNGAVNPSETNPIAGQGADDGDALNADTDGDGLPNRVEVELGSNVNDRDSDDDGVPDGEEANLAADTDGDGIINILDPDSDGDGLFDGTELGYACNGTGTSVQNPATCVADADPSTWTSPLNPDTDRGGMSEGLEDTNRNGRVDLGERDPLLGADDSWACVVDANCDASPTSGRVCNASHVCANGCRGTGGNGCPTGQTCSSSTTAIGSCSVITGTGGAAGAAGAAGAGPGSAGGSAIAGSAGTGVVIGNGGAGTAGVSNTAGVTATAGSIATAGTAGRGLAGSAGVAIGTAGTAGLSAAGAGAVAAGAAGAGVVAGAANVGGTGGAATGGTSPAEGGEAVATGGTATGGTATGEGGTGSPLDGDALEGAGCDCTVAGKNSNTSGWLLAMFAGLLGLRRRRSQ